MTDTVTLRGIEMHLHPPGEYVSDHMRDTGDFYEADILDELARRLALHPPGVLIDVGAMIGTHTVFMAHFIPHTWIHAFEPVPENLQLLRVNTAQLRNVEVSSLAISDRRQMLDIWFRYQNLGHCVVAQTDPWPDTYDQCFEVEAFPLDTFRFTDVRLIKIDVEGHEPQVLAGAKDTIARCHPLILIEDWQQQYAPLLLGYRVAAEWQTAHQTTLYEWA